MKKGKLKIVVSAAILLCSASLLGQTQSTNPQNKRTDIVVVLKQPTKNVSGRPKAPSRQSIECMYFDGNLSVDFFIPEGECTMTVTDSNTGISLQYIFSTEESAEIYVGNLSNAYFEFDTEAGNSYEGCLAE